uniref:CRAL-TRIO domain-containing protein n=1 Tax=Trichobilharzia regenti TaxID=157069 RepID=A0AA85ITL6_TRIRE|nr:unnamed protein product [Trichobilharzia regenti]
MGSSTNVKELVVQLQTLLTDLKSKPELEQIINNEENVVRFLKARGWDLQSAEKMMRKDLQWRQEFRPDLTDCKNCHNQPGTHSLRQIGFDEVGRPVIYASFCQAISHRNLSNDAVTHLIYTIENAVRSMKSGITQWVFVIDCTGKFKHELILVFMFEVRFNVR